MFVVDKGFDAIVVAINGIVVSWCSVVFIVLSVGSGVLVVSFVVISVYIVKI